MLQVDLVAYAGPRWDHADTVKCLLGPSKERVPLTVSPVLPLDVGLVRVLAAEQVDLNRVVDDEVHVHERVDPFRIAAGTGHGRSHGGQIHNGRDFTGVPAVVDLAAMRSAMARAGGDPKRVNPLVDVDLIIDHSVQVDLFRSQHAYQANIEWEYRRNGERYALLRWAQQAFDGVRVVPPGAGICHQVNLN